MIRTPGGVHIDWGRVIDACVASGNMSLLVEELQPHATKHAGTAPAKIKNQVIQALRKVPQDERLPVVLALCEHEDPTAQEIGAICVTDFYEQMPEIVNHWLHHLADSQNWEVREWAASACGYILEHHFDAYFLTMSAWVHDTSENVRRAAVLAVMYASRSKRVEFAKPLLDVLEPLLSDTSKYVMDNLGPFALGNALIKYYPQEVLHRLHVWIASDDPQIRWNVAMVFTAANAVPFADDAKAIFQTLASDSRPYVSKAVRKAIKNIERRTNTRFDFH